MANMTPWLLLLAALLHASTCLAHDLPALTSLSANCSREDSRHARSVLQQYLFKHLGDSAGHLPPDCPLHPALDMFRDQERHKSRKNKDQHKCGYCGKVFKAEPYLDKHMQKKHVDRIPEGATSCLANHCDSLHCEWFKLRHLEANSKAQIWSKRAQLGTQCVPFLAALARQSCHELAQKCFPVRTLDRAVRTSHHHGLKEPFEHHWDAARAFFEAYFCEAVTCNLQARDALLEHVVRSSTMWSRWKGQLVLLVVLLAVFYAGLYMWWWVSQQERRAASREDDPAGKLHRRPTARHLVPATGRMSLGTPTSPSKLMGASRMQVGSQHHSSPSRTKSLNAMQGGGMDARGLTGELDNASYARAFHSNTQTSLTQLHNRHSTVSDLPAGDFRWSQPLHVQSTAVQQVMPPRWPSVPSIASGTLRGEPGRAAASSGLPPLPPQAFTLPPHSFGKGAPLVPPPPPGILSPDQLPPLPLPAQPLHQAPPLLGEQGQPPAIPLYRHPSLRVKHASAADVTASAASGSAQPSILPPFLHQSATALSNLETPTTSSGNLGARSSRKVSSAGNLHLHRGP